MRDSAYYLIEHHTNWMGWNNVVNYWDGTQFQPDITKAVKYRDKGETAHELNMKLGHGLLMHTAWRDDAYEPVPIPRPEIENPNHGGRDIGPKPETPNA